MFPRLSGMTGTAWDARAEFFATYKVPSAVLATHRPMIRSERPDRHFQSQKQKLSAAATDIVTIHKTGAPVLVGGPSVEENEALRQELMRRGISDARIGFLSAAHDAYEARLIAQAGRPERITLATNMAGRGTDIILGGNPRESAEGRAPAGQAAAGAPEDNDPPAADHAALADQARRAGGLHVLLLQRQRSRRRDRQFIGRCARQGDPGVAMAFTCGEDELLAGFGAFAYGPEGEIAPRDQPRYEHLAMSRQDQNEIADQRARTTLAVLDGALSHQRKALYALRKAVLDVRVDWASLPWDQGELLIENAGRQIEPGEELVDFPLNWVATSVVARIGGPGLPDRADPGAFIDFVRTQFRSAKVGERYRASLRAREAQRGSFGAAVFAAVCDVVREALRPFGNRLAGEFCRIAALSCLDRCWAGLLLLSEERQQDLFFQIMGTRRAPADFEQRRFEDFLQHRAKVFDGFLDILLGGIPEIAPEAVLAPA